MKPAHKLWLASAAVMALCAGGLMLYTRLAWERIQERRLRVELIELTYEAKQRSDTAGAMASRDSYFSWYIDATRQLIRRRLDRVRSGRTGVYVEKLRVLETLYGDAGLWVAQANHMRADAREIGKTEVPAYLSPTKYERLQPKLVGLVDYLEHRCENLRRLQDRHQQLIASSALDAQTQAALWQPLSQMYTAGLSRCAGDAQLRAGYARTMRMAEFVQSHRDEIRSDDQTTLQFNSQQLASALYTLAAQND